MSLTLATNSGSLETLKLRTRCGLSPCSCQMRCTLVWLMPIAAAIVRTLQCVALAGRSFTVFSTTLSLMSSASGFLPGGLERPLTRPATPASTKYVLPAPDRRLGHPDRAHDRHSAVALSRHQHDARSLDDLLTGVAVRDDFPERGAILRAQLDGGWFAAHRRRESYSRLYGIHMSVTEH